MSKCGKSKSKSHGRKSCPKRKDGSAAKKYTCKATGKKYIIRRSASGKARRVYCGN